MTTAWTADHVGSLAPDAASLSAARKLRGKWHGTGIHDTALWGLCQGSGSRPYQTIVDLSGPAYKCSCPSRKFPCKHALSLLLSWSAGEVPDADAIADFAADWLGGRAARAEKAAAQPKPARVSAATADKRRALVDAGLGDLDIWLTDQVRTGLAQSDRSMAAFERVAARMVDAKAPAVAAALRQLPLLTAHSDWPRLLLREYARLHLLATAHARLESLSPALQASVRTHVGYSTQVDAVRAEPAVRDTWLVLGIRTTSENAHNSRPLWTRRVWLRGRTTARWALLVDHQSGSPSFPADTPPPGHQVDAEVHYYPAAAPLRAMWGARDSTPEPFTTLPHVIAEPLPRTAPSRHDSETATSDFIDRPNSRPASGPEGRAAHATAADEWCEAQSTRSGEGDSPLTAGTCRPGSHGNAAPARSADMTAQTDSESDTGIGDFASEATSAPGVAAAGAQRRGSTTETGGDDLVSGAAHACGAAASHAPRRGSIAAALVEQAGALGADPFLRSWPVLLSEVVPMRGEDGWSLVEDGGDALPVSVADGEPWRLLGLSGGHPVTVVGEWTVDGLVPVAAFTAGSMVDVSVAEANSNQVRAGVADAGSAGLVSAALVGTARGVADTSGVAAPVAAAVAGLEGDPAAMLLRTVALQDCFARGGVRAGAAEFAETAADDARPLLPQAAAARLVDLLTDNSPFLQEWFAMAGPRDFRAPDKLVATLLDRAKALAPHREPLLALAGARGRWLAAQHPGWRSLVRAPAADESVWSYGRAAERRAWLAQLRRRDPVAARDILAGSWGKESGPGKTELLAVLADGLTLDDEALLERALDDRRAEVRRLAADLLGRLPDSEFAHRMSERAAAWIGFGRRPVRPQLVTTGPGVLDDAARRDGVGDSFGYTAYGVSAYRADGAPDLAAEWLHRVVAATPLRHWERLLGTPQEAVRVAMTAEVRGPMFAGWSDAALAQRNPAWARALFGAIATTEARNSDSEKLRELFALQPTEEQVRHLRGLDSSWLAEIESLLRAVPRPWPGPTAEHVLRLLLERAQLSADRPGAPSLVPGSYRTLFRAASAHFPVELAGPVAAVARRCGDPYWEQDFDQLAQNLIQRKTMLEELQ